jgi:hypothetical protein
MNLAKKNFPGNEKDVEACIRHLRLHNIKEITIYNKLYKLISFFQFVLHEKVKSISKTDIEDYLSMKRQRKEKN